MNTSNNASGVFSIDNGGSSTCVVTKSHQEKFPSVKGLYGASRNLTVASGKYDYIVEYLGEKYVCGTLAKYDHQLPLQMHTKSKANIFYDLSTLVAIHQFGYLTNYLITSVPIKMLNDEEKNSIIKRLKRNHTLTVNGITKTFTIAEVKVAPETAVSYWIDEPVGKSRYIDLGSRTIGYASCINEDNTNRYIDTESGTFFGSGLEALEDSYNPKQLADFIGGRLLKFWDTNDNVYLIGGGALDNELVKHLQVHFPKATPLSNPVMSNALGMYFLGRVAYDMA